MNCCRFTIVIRLHLMNMYTAVRPTQMFAILQNKGDYSDCDDLSPTFVSQKMETCIKYLRYTHTNVIWLQ